MASIKSNNSIISKLIPKIEQEDLRSMLGDINTIDNEAIQRISNIVVSFKEICQT